MTLSKHLIAAYLALFTTCAISAPSSTDKTLDITISPVVLLGSIVDVDANWHLNNNLGIGANLTYWNVPVSSANKESLLGYGVRANYYFRSIDKSSPYISAFIKRWNYSFEDNGESGKVDSHLYFNDIGALGGYRVVIQSFVFSAGFGVKYLKFDKAEFKNQDGSYTFVGDFLSEILPAFDLNIGWSF